MQSIQRMLFLFVFYLTVFPINAQEYRWPTDASNYMTSSFCEFRPRHYHAAIDIKTWQKSGYKIFAVQDAYVYRLRISASGYGKAVYIKLRDGNIAVYAHLSGFSPALQAYADSIRIARQNNILDIFPDPGRFRVRRGDYLGNTGATGIGVPHLHFEIRNKNNHPVNPLQFYRHHIKDTIAPWVRALAVIPRDVNTFINYQPDTLYLPVQQASVARLSEPIYLSGNASLALRTGDQADGVSNVFDFYRAEMFINDSLAYTVQYDRFSYAENKLIELDKNFSLWRQGKRVYHDFYRHASNSLPFYGRFRYHSGLLNGRSLREGHNRIIIRTYDYFGNASAVEIPVIYHRIPAVTITGTRQESGTFEVMLKSREPLSRFKIQRVHLTTRRENAVARFDVQPAESVLAAFYRYKLRIPTALADADVAYRITPYYNDPLHTLPLYAYPDRPSSAVQPLSRREIRFQGDRVLLQGMPLLPEAAIDGDLFYWQDSPTSAMISLPVDQIPGLQALLGAEAQAQLANLVDPWHQVIPGRSRTVDSADKRLRVRFPTNAAYDTLFAKITTRPPRQPLQSAYRYMTDMYDVQPFDQPLNHGAYIDFQLPESLRGKKGLGVYYLDRRKGWLFLPTEFDVRDLRFSARVLSLEKFTVIQDTVAPILRPLNLAAFNSAARQNFPLRFAVRDEMSGIYGEKRLEVRLDDRWCLFELDPEEDLLFVDPRYIPGGSHTLRISVEDNAGNRTSGSFLVERK